MKITITPPQTHSPNSPSKFLPPMPSFFAKTKSAIHSPSQGSPFGHKITRQISEQVTYDDKENRLLSSNYKCRTMQNINGISYREFPQSPRESTRFENLHGLVASGALNSEILVRSYFHQIVEAVEELHMKEIAHLDLKLEQFVLNSTFHVRLLDSHCSQHFSDEVVMTEGTKIYRAPEIKDNSCNGNFAAADVYSMGIMLYALKTNEFPYGEKEDEDRQRLRFYSTFKENNKLYWEAKAKLRGGNEVFSQEFIELVNAMLENDASKRITIEEIKQSKWYQGPIVESESLNMDIKKKHRVLNERKFHEEQMNTNVRYHNRYFTPKRYVAC